MTSRRPKSAKSGRAAGARDAYAWLRDPNWGAALKDPSRLRPKIRAHLEAENDRAEEAMRDTEALQCALFRELKGRIQQNDRTVPDEDGDYAYYTRYRRGGEHPIFCRVPRARAAGKPQGKTKGRVKGQASGEQVLLDGNAQAKRHGYFEVAACEHSPDHRLLAYCQDTTGGEFYTLRVKNLNTGRMASPPIENVHGAVAWFNDGKHLIYVRLNNKHRPDKVMLHRVGDKPANDRLLYRERDPGFFVDIGKTRSGRLIVISAHDHATSEAHLLDADDPGGAPALMHPRETDLRYMIEERAGQLLIVTNADGAQDYKLMTAPRARPGRAHWRDLVAPRKGVLLEGLLAAKNFIVRAEREEGLQRLVVMSPDGGEHRVAFDEEAYELEIVPTSNYRSDKLRFEFSSMRTPARIYDYNMRRRTRKLRKQTRVPGGHDPNAYRVRRLSATAPDGARVPISLLTRRRAARKPAPLMLYGYGAYGYSTPAGFSTSRLSLVDRGFAYAIAHVRGGMEKGRAWYEDGKLDKKPNTFSDFIAAAECLCALGIARPGEIAIHGGSAGGLLIGAVVNQRPDLFKTAVAQVPFVDVLNTMCDASLPLTPPEWPEWGNPIEDRRARALIRSYSPYDNIKAVPRPHILATAGVSDPRVGYWEPAKWIAKMRDLKRDDRLLLLKTNMGAGHAGASGRFEYLHEVAFAYAFVLKTFGLHANAPAAKKRRGKARVKAKPKARS